MNYSQYERQYIFLVEHMFDYSPDEVPAFIYAEKLAELTEAYPDRWEQRADLALSRKHPAVAPTVLLS